MSGKPPLVPELKVSQDVESVVPDVTNSWILAAVIGGILVLYSLSRIISLQRRVRDLEARPPVDDIVMKGLIRHEVGELVNSLEARRNAVLNAQKASASTFTVPASQVVAQPAVIVPSEASKVPMVVTVPAVLTAAVATPPNVVSNVVDSPPIKPADEKLDDDEDEEESENEVPVVEIVEKPKKKVSRKLK